MELRRELSCHAHAPSFRLWVGDTHLCPFFSVFLHRWVAKAAVVLSFISQPASGALWETEWQWMGLELYFPRMFSKNCFILEHTGWHECQQSSCQENLTDTLTGHLLLLLAEAWLRSQGDRRHILLSMPICGKVGPLWLSLWKCVFYNCFMIITVLQWLVFLLMSCIRAFLVICL